MIPLLDEVWADLSPKYDKTDSKLVHSSLGSLEDIFVQERSSSLLENFLDGFPDCVKYTPIGE
ncbi:hypothetical protein OUZ56_029720 [Daphnia magna]|uniref:Uncharacterized protein n=1 Tax=Daphnia magna TaxID=35525 RepID=A0ABR0B7M4_9CRUS|nr:hypothetical protein OUZ56_029720 [Daphnia magna]